MAAEETKHYLANGAAIVPVSGDEPARCRDDDRDRRIACGRRRKQDAQRVALMELGQTGDAIAPAEAMI